MGYGMETSKSNSLDIHSNLTQYSEFIPNHSMANWISPFLLLFLLSICCGSIQSLEEGHITTTISNKGLDFLKNLLIEKAETSLVPLEVPVIEKTVKIPALGKVQMVLSDIVIESIRATSSTLKTGDTGIIIDVSGATANLSMNWKYSYKTWLIPISISDKGNATVQVEGLDVGLSFGLNIVEGSLKLALLECGCYVIGISIKLDGGASWLYQGLIDAFEGKIGSSIENSVSKKLKDAIVKLDSLLQSLPKEVPVTGIAALNVTLVDDPDYSESSVGLKIDGLISAKHEVSDSNHYRRLLQTSHSCEEADKMFTFSLHEEVFKSASSVYFEASKMQWIVDKDSDHSLLNTAEWRFIVPQLYMMYPNHDMNLNLSLSSLPTIKIENQQIKAKVPLDVVVGVLDVDKVIPVACFSTVISASVSAEISQNVVSGVVKFIDFTMSLEWSNIGDFHMYLLQTIMSVTLKTVIMPYINLKLSKGFQIPSFHGYELQDAQILSTDSWIVICSNVITVKIVGSQRVAVH